MSIVEQRSIVEPNAAEGIEEKLNPIGRAYYAFSTLLCTPPSLSPDIGARPEDKATETHS
jgi:hypothetical protein